jgi:hypothetical protein
LYVSQKISVQLDTKLIGGKAWKYLNSLKIHVNVTPADCQEKGIFSGKSIDGHFTGSFG